MHLAQPVLYSRFRGEKMNILLSSTKMLDPEILDNLSQLPDTSIYLSLSQEDSQRIIKEVNPEVVIINAENSGFSYASQLCLSHPDLEVYLYNPARSLESRLKHCNSGKKASNPKLAMIVDAFISNRNNRKPNSQ